MVIVSDSRLTVNRFICIVLIIKSMWFSGIPFTAPLFAEGNDNVVVAGLVLDVADDGSYIVVNEQKISTTSVFIASSGLKLGDRVRILAVRKDGDLEIQAIQFNCPKTLCKGPGEEAQPESPPQDSKNF
jgi:hypothetical protein